MLTLNILKLKVNALLVYSDLIPHIILGFCPNCNGDIEASRLRYGLPCSKCLPLSREEYEKLISFEREERLNKVLNLLHKNGNVGNLWRLWFIEEELKSFSEFFEKATKRRLWSIQRTWARRLFLGESFAIIAPTGVGKTTFLSAFTLYYALKGKKVYFIVPTRVLLKQVYEKILRMLENVNCQLKIIALGINNINKAELDISKYDVVISSATYLSRNFKLFTSSKFDLIIVDDVDALLKNSKNVDRVLLLLGFNQDVIDKAYKLVIAKINLFKALSEGNNENYKKYKEKVELLRVEIDKFLSENNVGQLIVSSATGRSRGLKAKVFKELLGFEAGCVMEYLRNVTDVYDEAHSLNEMIDKTIRYVKMFGKGGLVFVAHDLGLKVAYMIRDRLAENGVEAELAASGRRGYIEKFSHGEVEVLVGVASYYGVIVRGLDLPHIVRYAIFVGVPKFKIDFTKTIRNPIKLFTVISILIDLVNNDGDKAKLVEYSNKLKKLLFKLSYSEIRLVHKALEGKINVEGYLRKVKEFLEEIGNYVNKLVNTYEVKEKLVRSNRITVIDDNGKLYVVVPDYLTYIQASGRTSRLFSNGMTKGLALTLVDDMRVYNLLLEQLLLHIDSFSAKHVSEVNLEKLFNEIDRDREIVKEMLINDTGVKVKDPLKSALLIVESPNKARTIASFFGKPSKRRFGKIVVYEVVLGDPMLGTEDYMLSIVATRGHILDLTTDNKGYHGVLLEPEIMPIYETIKRCRSCGYQFTKGDICPRCKSSNIRDSIEIVHLLRKLAMEVDVVFIGTDPDTEGEKIAWDVYVSIQPYAKNVYRVEFHEITRNAIVCALTNPRMIDERLVEAQIVRRVEDRWIGFELSSRLWRVFGKHWLSAGRVQTPVLGWIIQRQKEWKEGRRVFVKLNYEKGISVTLALEPKLRAVKEELPKLNRANILHIEDYIEEKNPPPPYTIDSILFDASWKLRLDATKAMKILQELFEAGLITYHRTDSIHVSGKGFQIAQQYLASQGLHHLIQNRSWGPHGTHECIRPTRPIDAETLRRMIVDGTFRVHVRLSEIHLKVYDLIFTRFMASQMKQAKVKRRRVMLMIGDRVESFDGIIDVLEEGYTRILSVDVNKELENLRVGDILKLVDYTVWKGSLHPLYKQGDVVKLMKERGLGRPSTYTKILASLLRHGYLFETKRKYLVATKMGTLVYEYLTANFDQLVSEERTRIVEEVMRLIEEGTLSAKQVLRMFLEEISSITSEKPEKIIDIRETISKLSITVT